MNFSGAALGGLTPNVTSVLYSINKGYAVGLAPVSLNAKLDYPICSATNMLTVIRPVFDIGVVQSVSGRKRVPTLKAEN